MSLNIQPLFDYIVAQQEAPETKTASGIYLTESAQEKSKIVKVLAIGKEVKSIKVGDRIIYKNFSENTNNDIKLGLNRYILIKETDVQATVK